jgi:K(+)-stimulated pyrophosphate-energized sodium pump
MSDASSANDRPTPWFIGIAALLSLTFYCTRGHELPSMPKPAPAVAPQPAPAPAAEPAPAAAIPSLAKLYFEVGNNDLPNDAGETMKPIIEYLKANATSKAVISGYHDPTGDKAQNEVLAKNRAKAVLEALKTAGIEEERIVMQKPQETAGSGNDAEARRVEVSIGQ